MSLSSKPEQELADGGQGGSAGEGTPIDNQTSTVKRVFADYDESETQNMRKKRWYFDVKNTPCARNCLIHGILGGLGTGLLYYLKSNVVLRSCDFAVYGFVIVAYGSWRVCRYQITKQDKAIKETVIKMNEMKNKQMNQTIPPSSEGGTT